MAEHISKQFDLELETIRTRVLQMGGLVEAQMIAAIEALLASDLDALEQVIRDDALVNAMEVSLDEECQHIIAHRQLPVFSVKVLGNALNLVAGNQLGGFKMGFGQDALGEMAQAVGDTTEV